MLLLEGFAWDAQAKRYETIEELEAYAVRVAGTVGVMMAFIMGVRHPMVLASACKMGMAMQLTNIARDVGEDARAARLYLPLTWMQDEGLNPQAWLCAPVFSPALAAVLKRLLAHADALYRSAEAATAHLPWRCRPAIVAAARVYAEIGRELERRGLDSVNQRAVVAAGRKWQLLCGATMRSFLPVHQPLSTESCDLGQLGEAIRPLIETLLRGGDAHWHATKPRQAAGIERLAAVFERLEKLDRQQRAKQHPGFPTETSSMASGTSP
jgi:phytoene synthase